MLRPEIAALQDGQKLFVRKHWRFSDGPHVYDVTVVRNDRFNCLVELVIHFASQDEHTLLYYSGRTPKRTGLYATDFFPVLPNKAVVGEYKYRPCRR